MGEASQADAAAWKHVPLQSYLMKGTALQDHKQKPLCKTREVLLKDMCMIT